MSESLIVCNPKVMTGKAEGELETVAARRNHLADAKDHGGLDGKEDHSASMVRPHPPNPMPKSGEVMQIRIKADPSMT